MCQTVYHLPILTQIWVTNPINIRLMAQEMAILTLDHSYQRNFQMVPIHPGLLYLWTVILHLYYYRLLLLKMTPQIQNGHPDGVDIEGKRQEKDPLLLDNELQHL